MKKFRVLICEEHTVTYEVEAEDEEEARDLAETHHCNEPQKEVKLISKENDANNVYDCKEVKE